MKIKIETKKDMFGKNKYYTANFNHWEESANTKEEAKEKLINAIEWVFEQGENYPIIRWSKNSKTCFILTFDFYGYKYLTIDAGRNYPVLSTIFGRVSQKEALNYMDGHIDQLNESISMEGVI